MRKFQRKEKVQLPSEKPINFNISTKSSIMTQYEEVLTSVSSNFKNTATKNKKGLGLCWTQQQNRIYVNFLRQNQYLFSLSTRQRKQAGIHVLMSEVIKTRSSGQCRSHHQKMMKKYYGIKSIIVELTKILKKMKQEGEQLAMKHDGGYDKIKENELINYSDIELQASENSLWEQIMDVSNSICLHDFFI